MHVASERSRTHEILQPRHGRTFSLSFSRQSIFLELCESVILQDAMTGELTLQNLTSHNPLIHRFIRVYELLLLYINCWLFSTRRMHYKFQLISVGEFRISQGSLHSGIVANWIMWLPRSIRNQTMFAKLINRNVKFCVEKA
jgi:hypothetical protein